MPARHTAIAGSTTTTRIACRRSRLMLIHHSPSARRGTGVPRLCTATGLLLAEVRTPPLVVNRGRAHAQVSGPRR